MWLVVQLLSRVWLFVSPGMAAHQASLSFTTSWSLLKFMSIELVIPANHLILCGPLFLLPIIFPSIRIFSKESALYNRWPKYWCFSFSLSISNQINIEDWFPLNWLVWSPCSLRDSQVFFITVIWEYQFFSAQPSLWSSCHHHTWLLEKSHMWFTCFLAWYKICMYILYFFMPGIFHSVYFYIFFVEVIDELRKFAGSFLKILNAWYSI